MDDYSKIMKLIKEGTGDTIDIPLPAKLDTNLDLVPDKTFYLGCYSDVIKRFHPDQKVHIYFAEEWEIDIDLGTNVEISYLDIYDGNRPWLFKVKTLVVKNIKEFPNLPDNLELNGLNICHMNEKFWPDIQNKITKIERLSCRYNTINEGITLNVAKLYIKAESDVDLTKILENDNIQSIFVYAHRGERYKVTGDFSEHPNLVEFNTRGVSSECQEPTNYAKTRYARTKAIMPS